MEMQASKEITSEKHFTVWRDNTQIGKGYINYKEAISIKKHYETVLYCDNMSIQDASKVKVKLSKPIARKTLKALRNQYEHATQNGSTSDSYKGIYSCTMAIIQAHELDRAQARKAANYIGFYLSDERLDVWKIK